jgi:signal transduction histidine kinase
MAALAQPDPRRHVARDRTDDLTGKDAFRYGIALTSVAVAYALQRAIWPYVPPSPHLFFYPAVFIAGRVGGTRPGIFATVLATLAIAQGFLPPEGILVVEKAEDALDLLIFFGVGVGISIALGQLREALRREQAATLRATTAKNSTDATWSMVAHDLRTPLNVITLGSSELGRRSLMAPDIEKTLRLIQRSTDRARDLVDDALNAMRAAEGELRVDPTPCNARELCAHAVDAVALLATRKGVRLDCDASERSTVLCDQHRLEQVLTNLLGNAIKFTPEDGVVSLYVDDVDGGEGLRFSVRDTGSGIPPDEIDAIFTKFWTDSRRSGGSGLGLWIACAILDAHGSQLAVESRVGEGTTFAFTLPAVRITERGAAVPARAS